MKKIFVAGFFDPVKKELESSYQERLDSGSIIWVRQAGYRREVNLNELSNRYLSALAGVDDVLVLLAVLRGKEWVVEKVNGIIDSGRRRSPNIATELRLFPNAGDRHGVLDAIATFGLLPQTKFSSEAIRKKVETGKIGRAHV